MSTLTTAPTQSARAGSGRWPAGRRSRWSTRKVWTARALLVLATLALWAILGSTSESIAAFVSTPGDVAARLRVWAVGPQSAWDDLLATTQVALQGLVLGSAVAVALAVALAELPVVNRFLAPFLVAANVLPKVALIPLFILWFGIGDFSKVAFVSVTVFFIVFYNVLTRCSQARLDVRNHLRVLGAGRWRLVTELLLPTAWGALISGLRLSVAFSVFGAVLTEMMASNEGMGYLLAHGQATLQPDEVMAATAVVSTVAMIVDALLVRLDQHLAAWRRA